MFGASVSGVRTEQNEIALWTQGAHTVLNTVFGTDTNQGTSGQAQRVERLIGKSSRTQLLKLILQTGLIRKRTY